MKIDEKIFNDAYADFANEKCVIKFETNQNNSNVSCLKVCSYFILLQLLAGK